MENEHQKKNYIVIYTQIKVKQIAFGNKEHITERKLGVSVLLRLFISKHIKYAQMSTYVYVKYIMRYIRYFSELHNFRKEIVSAAG